MKSILIAMVLLTGMTAGTSFWLDAGQHVSILINQAGLLTVHDSVNGTYTDYQLVFDNNTIVGLEPQQYLKPELTRRCQLGTPQTVRCNTTDKPLVQGITFGREKLGGTTS